MLGLRCSKIVVSLAVNTHKSNFKNNQYISDISFDDASYLMVPSAEYFSSFSYFVINPKSI